MRDAIEAAPVETQEWTERRKLPDGTIATNRRTDRPAATAEAPPKAKPVTWRREGGRLVPYDPADHLGGPIASPDPNAGPSKPPVPINDPHRVPTIQELQAQLNASRGPRKPPRPAPSPAELAGRPACIPDPGNLPGCLPGWYPGKPSPRANKEILAEIEGHEKRKAELLRELQGLPPA